MIFVGTSGRQYDDRRGRLLPRELGRLILHLGAREVFVYFNNDTGGAAPRDARRVVEMLGVARRGGRAA